MKSLVEFINESISHRDWDSKEMEADVYRIMYDKWESGYKSNNERDKNFKLMSTDDNDQFAHEIFKELENGYSYSHDTLIDHHYDEIKQCICNTAEEFLNKRS